MLESLKSGKKIVGLNQTVKAIKIGNTKDVFLALDADSRIQFPIRELCSTYEITLHEVESMKSLGKICGIDVKAAVACLLS